MRNVLQDYLDEHSFRVVVKKKKNYLTYYSTVGTRQIKI